MTPPTRQEPDTEGLRALARQRLHDAATTGTSTVLGIDAMRVLMRLAVQPETAEDALVLQQELQIHQIEIEILAELLPPAPPAPPQSG